MDILRVDFDPDSVQANLVSARVSAHSYQHLENKEKACSVLRKCLNSSCRNVGRVIGKGKVRGGSTTTCHLCFNKSLFISAVSFYL